MNKNFRGKKLRSYTRLILALLITLQASSQKRLQIAKKVVSQLFQSLVLVAENRITLPQTTFQCSVPIQIRQKIFGYTQTTTKIPNWSQLHPNLTCYLKLSIDNKISLSCKSMKISQTPTAIQSSRERKVPAIMQEPIAEIRVTSRDCRLYTRKDRVVNIRAFQTVWINWSLILCLGWISRINPPKTKSINLLNRWDQEILNPETSLCTMCPLKLRIRSSNHLRWRTLKIRH